MKVDGAFDACGDWGIDGIGGIDHSLPLFFFEGQTPEDWFSSSNYYALLQPVIEMQRLGNTPKGSTRALLCE